MPRLKVLYATVAFLAFAAGGAGIHASDRHGRTLVVTMTNDPNANQPKVYDAFTYNRFGELAATGTTITVGVPDANGVAILSPRDDDRN